jgi:transcriptional regulator with XRE-family HTH domain
MIQSALAREVEQRAKRSPLSVDAHVGNKLRTRRVLAGMSQTELGRAVGITFQQVQKYEKAANRVSAGHLYAFAQALACTPDDFFAGYDPNEAGRGNGDPLLSDQEIELFKAYAGLDVRARLAVLEFARSLSTGTR